MNLTTILISGAILSIILHFIGVYAGAKKVVWVAIMLIWAGAINVAMSEIKPKGYEEIEKMKGNNTETDRLINEAQPEISVYEMLAIKKSFAEHTRK
ncbi:MAG: hypothetical protein NTW78_04275 [Campylobacterales bacterium]|nr:hypothetical protein [Campylobacterales bacterium]